MSVHTSTATSRARPLVVFVIAWSHLGNGPSALGSPTSVHPVSQAPFSTNSPTSVAASDRPHAKADLTKPVLQHPLPDSTLLPHPAVPCFHSTWLGALPLTGTTQHLRNQQRSLIRAQLAGLAVTNADRHPDEPGRGGKPSLSRKVSGTDRMRRDASADWV